MKVRVVDSSGKTLLYTTDPNGAVYLASFASFDANISKVFMTKGRSTGEVDWYLVFYTEEGSGDLVFTPDLPEPLLTIRDLVIDAAQIKHG